MTKKIQLTKGQTVLVDDDDFDFLTQWKWHVFYNHGAKTYYAVRRTKLNQVVYMHRVIMNTPRGLFVDHINHKGLDNRKENLRNVTSSQNAMNRGPMITNKLGIKGVRKQDNRYRAQIGINNKSISLGYFLTAEEAKAAYDKAANLYHGKFKKLK